MHFGWLFTTREYFTTATKRIIEENRGRSSDYLLTWTFPLVWINFNLAKFILKFDSTSSFLIRSDHYAAWLKQGGPQTREAAKSLIETLFRKNCANLLPCNHLGILWWTVHFVSECLSRTSGRVLDNIGRKASYPSLSTDLDNTERDCGTKILSSWRILLGWSLFVAFSLPAHLIRRSCIDIYCLTLTMESV